MTMINQNNYVASAFVSCSLRSEDEPFVNLIEQILDRHRIKPFGTVGRHSFAHLNVSDHMRLNIPKADFVVIVATPRYIQQDLKTNEVSHGLAEMVHVETGMAFMAKKPVVVFVKEGTQLGGFLPNITEYVVLNGEKNDLKLKWPKITNLLNNTYKIIAQIKENENSKNLRNILTTGLATYGLVSILNSIFSENDEEDEE